MRTNKEKLEKLIEQIKQLERLTEEISEREIYPVSFFSQAFDIANKILEYLQQVETSQIELIKNQEKEHHAQILSAVCQSANTLISEDTILDASALSEQQKSLAQSEQETDLTYNVRPAVTFEPTIIKPQLFSQEELLTPVIKSPPMQQVRDEEKVTSAYSSRRNNKIDLKKGITLNDRFLFCRELFANNENLMNQVFSELNSEDSYETAIEYLQKRFDWNFEDKNVTDFLAILKKRFT